MVTKARRLRLVGGSSEATKSRIRSLSSRPRSVQIARPSRNNCMESTLVAEWERGDWLGRARQFCVTDAISWVTRLWDTPCTPCQYTLLKTHTELSCNKALWKYGRHGGYCLVQGNTPTRTENLHIHLSFENRHRQTIVENKTRKKGSIQNCPRIK